MLHSGEPIGRPWQLPVAVEGVVVGGGELGCPAFVGPDERDADGVVTVLGDLARFTLVLVAREDGAALVSMAMSKSSLVARKSPRVVSR